MSAILKMLEAAKTSGDFVDEYMLSELADEAAPDIQRLVSWVESAEHKELCGYNYQLNSKDCNCGLSELLSLIRS